MIPWVRESRPGGSEGMSALLIACSVDAGRRRGTPRWQVTVRAGRADTLKRERDESF